MLNLRSLFLIILLSALTFGQACSSPKEKITESSLSYGLEGCRLPQGLSGNPKSVKDVVIILNSLPTPISVACFLSILERPLTLTLTSNSISAQPAAGQRSPRILIFNDKLIISIVPDGPGSEVIEFSEIVSTNQSIKAEIDFPVTTTLSHESPFERILLTNQGTSCAVCHSNEQSTSLIDYANAFSSTIIRPPDSTSVPLTWLQNEARICDEKKEPERCSILNALFDYGKITEGMY